MSTFNFFPTGFNGTMCDDYDYIDSMDWECEEPEPITKRSPEPQTQPPHPLAKKIQYPDGSEGMRCVKCSNDFPDASSNQDNGTFKCRGCIMWENKE